MNSLEALRLAGFAGLGSLIAMPACAQADPGFPYIGGSIGQSHASIDDARITAELLAAGLTTSSMTDDESDMTYKLFGGYQFNRYVGLEGGYFDLGKFSFKSTTTPDGTLAGQIRLHGVNLDLVGMLPLSGSLSLMGRVGAQYATARDAFTGSGAVAVPTPNWNKSETNYKFGAGLQYAFTPNLMLRGEAERYRINDAVGNHGDVNVFTAGLVYAFGRASPPSPHAAAAPAYEPPVPVVAVAAPPAPPPPPPPQPPPAPRRVSFSADALFAFDASVIQPKGKLALDEFLRQLAGTQFDTIVVEGHTDRLGTQAYNQRLSERRAGAVKAYLVAPGGIDATKISVAGKGESVPVTQVDDCKGAKPSPRLIACLQPDRRVDVEVTGTRTRSD